MKGILILILVMLVFIPGPCAGDWYSKWDGAGKTWTEKWDNTLSSVESFPLDERMELLGRGVMLGSQGMPSGDKGEVFKRAQNMMLAIPGHAKHYQDKIESLRAEVLANTKIPDEVARLQQDGKQPIHIGDYNDFRKVAFPVLGLLPSSESVAVLGHFLNDPESRDGRFMTGELIPRNDYQHYPPNCAAAYIAIANLGIENPPGDAKPDKRLYDYDLDQVDAWKEWWNEVKEGRRTYRFIGSSIEYGPDGPASKEVIQRVERDRKRDEERTAGHKKSSITAESESAAFQASKPSSIAWLVASIGLCAAAVGYFVKNRKSA